MINLPQSKQLVSSFLKEACRFLSIDECSIFVVYMPLIEPIHAISYIAPNATLIISEQFLKSCIMKNSFSPLRHEIYCKSRMLEKQKVNPIGFDQYCTETIHDAIGFSLALLSVKGFMIPSCEILDMQSYINKSKEILLTVFGLHGVYDKEQLPYNKQLIYKLRLEESDKSLLYQKYVSRAPSSQKKVIDSLGKGSKENPFDNIYEACDFIKKMESEAYQADNVIQSITNEPYFYDFNNGQFRVPFASPHVSYYRSDIPKNAFIVNQNISGKYTLKPNLYRQKFLYRGQNRDYPKPCTPNLFRNENKNYFLDDLIWGQELELLMRSHPLVKLLDLGVDILHDRFAFFMNYGGVAQHYYNKTRFLDLTSDIEAMQFFATTNYCWDNDEYFPVLDTEDLGLIYCYELRFPDSFRTHSDEHHLSVIGKQVFMRSGAQHGFLLDLPKKGDLKKTKQVKTLYFKHNPQISMEIFEKAEKGAKYFPSDILETFWKEQLKKRLKEKKVSIDTVKLNVSRNAGETEESIIRKLETLGIEVDKTYKPSFNEEQLDSYYKDIQNGWWDNFCADIYFYGSDSLHYKEELKQIVKRREYEWAFKRTSTQ